MSTADREVKLPPNWKADTEGMRSGVRYMRPDGAVVRYDTAASTITSEPWLPGHRGWMAFLPGPPDSHATLSYKHWHSAFRSPIKFKTPEAAMKALDKKHPFTSTEGVPDVRV